MTQRPGPSLPQSASPFCLCHSAFSFLWCPSPKFSKFQVQLRHQVHQRGGGQDTRKAEGLWFFLECTRSLAAGGSGERQSQVGEGHGRAARCPCGPDQDPRVLPRAQPCRACFTRRIFLISRWLPRPQASSRPERWGTRGDGNGQTPSPACALEAPGSCWALPGPAEVSPGAAGGCPGDGRPRWTPGTPDVPGTLLHPRGGGPGLGPGTQAAALLSASLAAGPSGQTGDVRGNCSFLLH